MINKVFRFLFILFFCFSSINLSGSNIPSSLESQYQPYDVGELGAKWQLPSDHLPIGATVGDFRIAFWNILNKNYLNHIEENTQGLRDSSILKDNIPVRSASPLTIREEKIGKAVLEMIHHSSHSRSLIALQETHADVIELLKQSLPSNWVIVTPPDQPASQDIFLYDRNIFDFISKEAVKYSPNFPKTIFTLNLREKSSNKSFRFVQSHIPGGPNSAEGCTKFAEEAIRQYDPNLTIILMGDMNQSPGMIEQYLERAAKDKGISEPYRYLPISYPSHINTKLQASWIDNFFVYSPGVPIRASNIPEEIFSGLIPTVKLLNQQTVSKLNPLWQKTLDYAEANLPKEGLLMIKSDGFGYIKVDDDYIHALFPMLGLEKDGFREPPYFRSKEAPGAHISVFYEAEHIVPEEVGQLFHFKLKDIVIVEPKKGTYYAILQVDAPELEALRQKYGLRPKLQGHEFHISIAKKK